MKKNSPLRDLEAKQMVKYIKLLKQMEDKDEREESPHRLIARKIYEELFAKEKSRS